MDFYFQNFNQTKFLKTHTQKQVGWCVFSFAIVGLIPYRPLRRWANDEAFKISFRLITRSISGLVKFHNPEFRPKNCGFCVANHTSPIDISILSTDCSYSLVRFVFLIGY